MSQVTAGGGRPPPDTPDPRIHDSAPAALGRERAVSLPVPSVDGSIDPALAGALAPRYTVQRELGRGGMATVYQAWDERRGALVALKVMRAEIASLINAARFAREVRITAQLQHPHLVPVLESGDAGGVPFYTMPCVAGESLAARLAREGPLPTADALRVASQVADALAYAHARGFVHRDIKPGNVLLGGYEGVGGTAGAATGGGGTWHALLSDFGIARALDAGATEYTRQTLGGLTSSVSETGMVVGTVSYMSPEQAAGERVDGRSDVYGLGCVLYEMLAGTPPFAAPTARAVIARHMVDPVPSLQAVRPGIPAGIEAIVMTALAKVPADRFADAAAFTAALDAQAVALATGSLTAGARGRRPRGAGGSRGRRWWIAAAAGVIGLAALGVAFAPGLRGAAWPWTRALDAHRVLVFPFVTAGVPGVTGRTVGEDVATVVGTVIDGVGPIRAVDGWRLMNAAERRDVRALGPDDATRLSREQRARYYLTGRVVARGTDSTEVVLELADAAGDSVVARGSAVGRAADAWRVGLRAINGVLPALVGTGSAAVLADWADRDPGAMASFLLGEASFRRLALADALGHYREAVRRDSGFALAALRGAQAAGWALRRDEAATLVDVALRRPLPARYAHFARGYQAYVGGLADSAAAEFRRALALDPEMGVAWMQLGETYTHLLPAAGTPDRSADSAFTEAHRLDPSASDVLFHLIEIRLRQGQIAAAAPLVAQFAAVAPESSLVEQIGVMRDCVRGGPAAVDWAAAVRRRPLAVLGAGQSLAAGLSQPRCAEAAYAAVIAGDTGAAAPLERQTALFGLAPLLLARGRGAAAIAAIDASIARGDGGATLFLLLAPVAPAADAPALAARAAAVAAGDAARYGPDYAGAPAERRWMLGVWEASHGRGGPALAAARALARDSGASPLLAPSAAAWAALAAGDTTLAMGRFDALLAAPQAAGPAVAWGIAEPRGAARLAYARLLVARGARERAVAVLGGFESPAPQLYALYLPAARALRAAAGAGP